MFSHYHRIKNYKANKKCSLLVDAERMNGICILIPNLVVNFNDATSSRLYAQIQLRPISVHAWDMHDIWLHRDVTLRFYGRLKVNSGNERTGVNWWWRFRSCIYWNFTKIYKWTAQLRPIPARRALGGLKMVDCRKEYQPKRPTGPGAQIGVSIDFWHCVP